MSDYTGPGIYEIIPHHAQTMSLNIWGGGPEVGTAVKIHPITPGAENTQFEIVAAGGTNGNPEIGDREYHIIGVNSGLYLASGSSNNKITMEIRPPKNSSIRWKLARAGNGAFYIKSIDGKKQLTVLDAGTTRGTEVVLSDVSQVANSQFVLKLV